MPSHAALFSHADQLLCGTQESRHTEADLQPAVKQEPLDAEEPTHVTHKRPAEVFDDASEQHQPLHMDKRIKLEV